MSEPEKSIWTRHHSLPHPPRWIFSLFNLRRLRRCFFCLLFCLACLATMIALFYAEEDLRGKRAWESYMRQSKAKGIELDWRAYIPPPVPDDQNFAITPPFEGMFDYEWTTNNVRWRDSNIWSRLDLINIISSGPTKNLGDWVHGRPLDIKQWQAYFRSAKFPETNHWPVRGEPQEPAKDVLAALSKLDPDLAALRQASARPQSRFPIHYDEQPKALLVHLGFLRNISRVLQLRAVAELESGSHQQAFADANLAFYCADAIKSDACMISQIVRCHIIEGGLQPIWEGLGAHHWSEDQLKEFERNFSKTDLLSQYDQSFKSDMAFTCAWIESLADDPSTFSMVSGGPSVTGAMEAAMDANLLPRGWFYQNELSAARFFNENFLADVSPQTQRVYPGLSRTNSELFDKLPCTLYSFAFKHLGSVVSPQGFVHTQTEINLALVACALERHRLARGHFPETLDALAPEFLEKLPRDIINGEPLKYRLTSAGRFVLYSVGWNEKDDGGTYPGTNAAKSGINPGNFRDSSKYHPETGDWVWEYPE
jgi:hypothetical protein